MENIAESIESNEAKCKLNSKNAWILPLLCWGMTVATGLFGSSFGVFINLVFAIVETILLIATLVVAIKVLNNKDKIYSKTDKNHAKAGLGVAGITIIIILAAIVATGIR
jgi:hypothetical protein